MAVVAPAAIATGAQVPTKSSKKWSFHFCSFSPRTWKGRLIMVVFVIWIYFSSRYSVGPSEIDSTEKKQSSTDTTTINAPDYCQHYDGVLLISQGDRNGAAGTIFYLFVLNQLLYGRKHNLQPWIHLNSASRHVYDPQAHGGDNTAKSYTFPEEWEPSWDYYHDPLLPDKSFPYPGKPIPKAEQQQQPISITVHGTGVWNSYFESIVPLQLGQPQTTFQVDLTKPCPNKPLVRLTSDQELVQGLHLHCPYCVRSWRYGGVPPSLKKMDQSYQEWWAPMRDTGRRMVSTYYQLKPSLQRLVEDQKVGEAKCLALHIRHSDKANKRTKIPLDAFLPYCQAFVEQGGRCIFVATDSSRVLTKMQAEWPSSVVDKLQWQTNIVRSPNATAVFEYAAAAGGALDHDRTNREVLVDIHVMAQQCDWFLHGLSAVSEATFYTASPELQSVNLEFYTFYKRQQRKKQKGNNNNHTASDSPLSVDEFRAMLQRTGLGKSGSQGE